jgi:transposase-like protein
MSRPGRTSSTSPSSSTPLPGASSAGGCRAQHGRTSYSTRSSRRCVIAARSAKAAWCTTAIAACKADSSGRRNTLTEEVAMAIRKRRSDRSGRAPLFSPGRPPVAGCDERRRFWAAIAAGMASEDAAVGAGVSQAVGTRWFRKAGGMPPAMFARSAKPLSGRYLSFAEREEIALLHAQGSAMQEVARRLGRAASTISRELRRNAARRGGGLAYRATTAQWHAERAARRPKPAKLARNAALRTYVEERLAGDVMAPSGAPVPGPAVCCVNGTGNSEHVPE